MKSRLKNLYKHLIENRKHEVIGWHDEYSDIYKLVKKFRKRIEEGEELSENNEEFLKKLLYEKSNGIASRGQSVLSNEDFKSFIQNEDFLSALKQLIQTPDNVNFTNFNKAWIDQGKSNNPVLINRVAAA